MDVIQFLRGYNELLNEAFIDPYLYVGLVSAFLSVAVSGYLQQDIGGAYALAYAALSLLFMIPALYFSKKRKEAVSHAE